MIISINKICSDIIVTFFDLVEKDRIKLQLKHLSFRFAPLEVKSQ